jgi:DMSO/TMAO reductase YedYZ molybdopterin-dependent catalytic subunit
MADTMDAVPGGAATSADITREELQLALRNHGMPLEALRHDVTPIGLHYLLIHYDIPLVDPTSWRLSIRGLVHTELSLTLDDLAARPRVTQPVMMECAGNGRARLSPRAISQPWLLEAVGNAEWTGTPLRLLLEEAGLADGAVEVVFTGLDRGVEGGVEQSYERSLPLAEAQRDEVLLAYAVNGQPLPPQHGYPLRLLVPGWYGMTSVKWLTSITVTDRAFDGYQQTRAYRYRQGPGDDGEAVTLMAPRALLVPPGIPDFLSRRRFLAAGPCPLEGRAWSGSAPITRVEVSTDGGRAWRDADVAEPPGVHAWHHWTLTWEPDRLGEHVLCCRATDAAFNRQPLQPRWNLGGYAVNDVQRVTVTVTN